MGQWVLIILPDGASAFHFSVTSLNFDYQEGLNLNLNQLQPTLMQTCPAHDMCLLFLELADPGSGQGANIGLSQCLTIGDSKF